MKPTTERRAAIYLRVSTEEQAAHGISLDAQEHRARAYCELAGLTLHDTYRDAGVSAGNPLHERPEGRRLLDAVARGEVQHVVALKLDRLFRDAIDALQVAQAWEKRRVAMHLIDMGGQTVNTASAAGRFLFSVLAAAAEMERNLIRERTVSALAEKKRQGQRLGGIPLGFRAITPGGPLEPVDAELAVVRTILRQKAKGASLRAIVRRLDEEGHRTKNGGRWAPQTVANVIERRAQYRGLV